MKKIRLGIVRCSDIHGYYFGVMLQKCDPLLLQKYYYAVHHYASNIYNPEKITFPFVDGFEISKVWDYDLERTKKFSKVFFEKPQICKNLEELTEDIDAIFISNGERDGSDHLELSAPFIKKGIPTFIDKPFAATVADAKKIVSLAEKNNTLIFNASILSYVPAAAHFRARFQEIDHTYYPVPDEKPSVPIGLGVIKGVGGSFSQELAGKGVGAKGDLSQRMAYLIHGVALSLNLFGNGVEYVRCMGDQPLENIKLHLKSGRDVVIINTSTEIFPEACNFYASAYSKYGAVHSNPIGDYQFIGGGEIILKIFKEMIKTGKAPVPYKNFIEQIAIIEATKKAQETGAKVYIKDIMKGK